MPEPSPRPPSPIVEKTRRLQGPILVLGASGFVGANLMRTLLGVRNDVHGTTTRTPAWRLEGLPPDNVRTVDLLIDSNLEFLLDSIRPRTVFNCVAYGAYSFETDSQLIYRTNFQFITRLLSRLEARAIACYVHAGSSSEYGDKAAGPREEDPTAPNSDYAVSKVATANLIYYYGKRKHFPCANLRLYSVFGPLEDSSRLIPNLIRRGLEAGYPDFVNPAVSRDFIYVDDVTESFVDTALNLSLGRLRRVVQHRHGTQDHDRRGRRDGPQAIQHPGGAGLHDARARVGRSRLVRQCREGPPAPGLGTAHDVRGGPPEDHRMVQGDFPTSRATSSCPRNMVWTPSTASARSQPATRTTWRFRSCTSASRPHSPG